MMAQTVTEALARVVVIDDTPDLRLLLRMVLELSDRYEVVAEAGDGITGIEAVREWQPDLVLLDLAMPVMDGLEALPAILAACPATSVVVLSGFEADRMAGQALDLGAAAYLQKGKRPDEMVAALDEVLGRSAPPPLAAVPDPPDIEADPAAEIELVRSAFATAAHELRTPATVLIGLAQTLTRKRGELDPQRADELLDAILRQTRVLDRLTADLLISTQASRGELAAHSEQIDLVPVLRAAALTIAEIATVTLDVPDSLQVVADSVRAQQMLTNLLSNALKYAAAPIEIIARSDGTMAVIRVEDSGTGVPAEFQEQMFEQYSRLDQGHSSGTGLGLYVVRALAEAQGGTVWYETRAQGGSAFCFTLPLAP